MNDASGSSRGSRSLPPIGERFGRWVVVGTAPRRGGKDCWTVMCSCDREHVRQAHSIRSGASTGCSACQRHDGARKHANKSRAADGRHTREYKAYRGMLDRCYDHRAKWWSRYGGRGIGVCDAWRDSFDAFAADMGPSPGRGYSIDRIDNDRGYAPGNCRWATAKTQARNTRRNRILTIDDRAQCVAAWAEERGLAPQVIFKRLRLGWSDRDAVMRPRASELRAAG